MENTYLKLSDMPTGGECVVVKVHGHGSFRNRIVEMGFVRGVRVKVVKNAPLHDPIEYELMNTHISLRRSESELIEVVGYAVESEAGFNGTFTEEEFAKQVAEKSKTINIALVGNPNCGKTSFFNRATGLREKVGNYSGVINLVDLPGTYSITEYTPEEIYVREYVTGTHPDMVLNVVDATNLERNLFLTTQLIDMNIRVIMALNMFDELTRGGDTLDYDQLGRLLGIPIIPTTASKGIGVEEVLDKIIEVFEDRAEESRHVHINYGQDIEAAITRIKETVLPNREATDAYTPRYIAIKLLEDDRLMKEYLQRVPNYPQIEETARRERQSLERAYKEDVGTIIINAKYGFVRGALKETFHAGEKEKRQLSTAIDTLLTHRWLGFPFLIVFMWVMFEATFTLGAYPQEWIEAGVGALGEWVASVVPEGPLNDLLVDGIISGVGGVIVFLPNILILFFFISLMEDTGYMARAAFMLDRLMHKIGLHGKSFIPLLIGFGCSVPAIMATRTLESRRDRIVTMLITPFMSCSARLPVYILLVSAFFPNRQGLVLLSIYFVGILLAILTSLLLKKTLFAQTSEPFVMELPPYRMPTARNTLIHMWGKSVQYLKKMGTIILFASILIWALGYFPVERSVSVDAAEHMEESYIGQIGKAIEPAIAPLGFDWKMGVSIITGVAAKEIVVSSMGILYHVPDADESSEPLIDALHEQVRPDGTPVFTPLVAYGFMLFVLIYFPCMATIAAIKKEAGTRWALFSMVYTTALAWVVSFLVYQIGSLF